MLNSDRVIMLCYFRCDYKSLGSQPHFTRKMTADLQRVNKRILKLRYRLHMEVRKIERSNRAPVEESQRDAWQGISVSSIAPFFAAFGSCVSIHGSLCAQAESE